MKITEPGIYRDIPEAAYFKDPCPDPSLTQSICKILLERSGMHAAHAHPRLMPQETEPEDYKRATAIGNAAHKLMLQRGREIEILSAPDFRSKEAREKRDAAHAAGKLPILEHHFAEAEVMVQRARSQLELHEDCDAFTRGAGEVMLAWQEDGIWFRALVDWLHDDLRHVDDFKTSAMSVAPHVLGVRAEAGGWHIQAAMIERGLDVLDPAGAGHRRFRFIAQEQEVPHALVVMHMNEHWMTMGRKQVDAAIQRWKRVLQGAWDAYPLVGITPDFPGHRENRWLEREEIEFAGDLRMAG